MRKTRSNKSSLSKKKVVDKKTAFRRSKTWKTFRDKLRKKQKIDPITGSVLTKGANCHHGKLDSDSYADLSDESQFVMLNSNSHSLLHFVYGDTNKKFDWRTRLKRLEELCIWMDEINGVINNNIEKI